MYKTVFERMPIAAVYLDNDGKVLLWNKMAAVMDKAQNKETTA